jgi:hypothetical protein
MEAEILDPGSCLEISIEPKLLACQYLIRTTFYNVPTRASRNFSRNEVVCFSRKFRGARSTPQSRPRSLHEMNIPGNLMKNQMPSWDSSQSSCSVARVSYLATQLSKILKEREQSGAPFLPVRLDASICLPFYCALPSYCKSQDRAPLKRTKLTVPYT